MSMIETELISEPTYHGFMELKHSITKSQSYIKLLDLCLIRTLLILICFYL